MWLMYAQVGGISIDWDIQAQKKMCVWQAEGEKITYSMHGAMLKRKEWSRWSSSGSLKTGSSLRSQGLFLHPRSILYKQPNVGEIERMGRSSDMGNKYLFITKWESKRENYTDVENREQFCLGKMKIWACHHLTAQFILFTLKEDAFLSTVLSSHHFLSWNGLCTGVLVSSATLVFTSWDYDSTGSVPLQLFPILSCLHCSSTILHSTAPYKILTLSAPGPSSGS